MSLRSKTQKAGIYGTPEHLEEHELPVPIVKPPRVPVHDGERFDPFGSLLEGVFGEPTTAHIPPPEQEQEIKASFPLTEQQQRVLEDMEEQKQAEKDQARADLEWGRQQDRLEAEIQRMEDERQQTEEFRDRTDEEILQNFISVQIQKELQGQSTNLTQYLSERGYDITRPETIPTSVLKSYRLDTEEKMIQAGVAPRIIQIRLTTGEIVEGEGVDWLKKITSESDPLSRSQLIDQATRNPTLVSENAWLREVMGATSPTNISERITQVSRQIVSETEVQPEPYVFTQCVDVYRLSNGSVMATRETVDYETLANYVNVQQLIVRDCGRDVPSDQEVRDYYGFVEPTTDHIPPPEEEPIVVTPGELTWYYVKKPSGVCERLNVSQNFVDRMTQQGWIFSLTDICPTTQDIPPPELTPEPTPEPTPTTTPTGLANFGIAGILFAGVLALPILASLGKWK